jgi:hypothetical protein
MADETREIELTKEDILFLRLNQELANWCGVPAKDYRQWLYNLLPVEEGNIKLFPLREVDIECHCLLSASSEHLSKIDTNLDSYVGTALGEIIRTLRICSFVDASRKRSMADGQSMFWAVRRYKEEAWYVEIPATEEEKTKELLRLMLG